MPAGHAAHPAIGQAQNAISHQFDLLNQQVGAASQHLDKIQKSLDALTHQLTETTKTLHPGSGFVAEMKWPDYIQAGLLGVAILAALVTAFTLWDNSKGRDLENYLNFQSLFDSSWERFSRAATPDKYYTFLALMNVFEMACDMHNRKAIPKATRAMLQSYLSELLPQIWADPAAAAWIQKAKTGSDTFGHIKKFAAKHQLQGVPYQ